MALNESVASIASHAHPELEPVARSGTAGEIVSAIEPYTEADPAAVLANLLVYFGAAVGFGPHMTAGGVRHPSRLYVAVVGDTSVSRKGTARGAVHQVLGTSRGTRLVAQIRGLGSGEGLIQALADMRPNPGGDRSLLVVADELARVITVMNRRDSTLSPILREAWDSDHLAVTTRSNPIEVTRAHVCIVAEATVEEVTASLPTVQMMNGFGNRFLWVLAKRSQLLPEGGGVPPSTAEHLAGLFRRRVMEARSLGRSHGGSTRGEMRRTGAGVVRWREVYEEVSVPRTGVVGAATARAEAQILRLSIVYALLDGSGVIDVPHIDAAYGFWRYCEKSVALIFANTGVDSVAAKIETVVEQAGPAGIRRSDLQKVLSNHLDQSKLTHLIESGRLIEKKLESATGRPPAVLVHANHAVEAT